MRMFPLTASTTPKRTLVTAVVQNAFQMLRQYYVRARLRKADIKRGTHCRDCAGVGSAERTRASRAASKRKLIEHAATLWSEWKPERRYGSRSKWVAYKMKAGFTGRWVSQHRVEIEAEVERRAPAKGF